MAEFTKTNVIIEENEVIERKVIPTVHSEIERDVLIKRNSTVKNSVYGDDIEIQSDVKIDSSIMGSTSVELEGARVSGDVGCAGRIIGSNTFFESSISGTSITLQDSIICGNIVGTNVRLENCLVVGIISSLKDLTLQDSLCYTFKAFGDSVIDNSSLLLPQAIVNGKLEIKDHIEILGLSIVNEGEDTLKLFEDDLISHDETNYLSLADRFLDLSGLEKEVETLEKLIRDIIENSSTFSREEIKEEIANSLNVEIEQILN